MVHDYLDSDVVGFDERKKLHAIVGTEILVDIKTVVSGSSISDSFPYPMVLRWNTAVKVSSAPPLVFPPGMSKQYKCDLLEKK